jgi:ATP-dependent RNA circularization protein (DNA/RNA ligase family)
MEDSHFIYKFPRTSHLVDTGSVSRDDLVADKNLILPFLSTEIIVEEKVDGANLGISIDEDWKLTFQNRSHYVTSATSQQWKGLETWTKQHPELYQILNPSLILFGEWMYAKHSIHYTKLPDLFLVFDIFDKKEKQFWSVKRRNELLAETTLKTVPEISRGKFTKDQLLNFLTQSSKFYNGPVEGIYLRRENSEYLSHRSKIVRSDFLQTNEDGEVEHWSKGKLVRNIVQTYNPDEDE